MQARSVISSLETLFISIWKLENNNTLRKLAEASLWNVYIRMLRSLTLINTAYRETLKRTVLIKSVNYYTHQRTIS